MRHIAVLKNRGTDRYVALIPHILPKVGMHVRNAPSKGAVPGVDLTSFPLGGKTQAARPIRFTAASGPELAVELGEAKGKTGFRKWEGNSFLA